MRTLSSWEDHFCEKHQSRETPYKHWLSSWRTQQVVCRLSMLPAPPLQKRTKQFHIISTLRFHHSYGTTLEKMNFIGRLRSFALSCFRYLEGGNQQEQGAEATSMRSFMLQLSPLCLSQKYLSTRCSLIFLPGRIIHVRKINKETNLTGLNSSLSTEERLLALAVRLS